jgi:hypothetical protein
MKYAAYALAAVAAAGTASAQQPLQLTCSGGGTANKVTAVTTHSNAQVSGMVGTTPVMGSGSGNSTTFIPRAEGFSDQVDITLFAGDDKIRLPASIVPPIHGGDAGWYKLQNVVADGRTIRAKAAINFINHPKVYIDRVTGTISISGRDGDYSGQCQMIDANAAPKF